MHCTAYASLWCASYTYLLIPLRSAWNTGRLPELSATCQVGAASEDTVFNVTVSGRIRQGELISLLVSLPI